MTGAAIEVAGLSKRYRIGVRHRDRSLRRAVTDLALSPVRRLRSFGRSSHREEDSIWALRDVSFEVQAGEVLGVVGRNGAGKTTLLKILSRITDPTEGRAVLEGRVASLLEVGTGFHEELTGRENVYLSGAILGLRKAEIDARFDEIVDFSGVARFIDTPVKRYSTGMRVRLGFAVSAHLEPEILLVDEILAVGDAAFRQRSLGKMGDLQRGGRAVVFVSHDMASVRHLCTRCIALDEGRIIAAGEPAATVEAYLQRAGGGVSLAEGYRFDVPRPAPLPEAYITRVELLDEADSPAQRLETGGRFHARVHFRCRDGGRFSLLLRILTPDGVRLIAYPMEGVGARHVECSAGDHYCDLVIPRLPLAAGRYVLGVGISRPRSPHCHVVEGLGAFQVLARDVFGTGRPITSRRCLLALDHSWEIPPDDSGLGWIA